MSGGFFLITLSLLSGGFSLGAVTILFLRDRTVILRLVLLFLLSLVLINTGFWLRSLEAYAGLAGRREIPIITALVSLPGMVLNVAVLPHFAAALVSRTVHPRLGRLLLVWDGVLLAAGLLYPLLPGREFAFLIMNTQLLVTILGTLVFLALSLREVVRRDIRRGLALFTGISVFFFLLLVPDILITRLSWRALAFLDDISLPLYFLVLNGGSFLYVRRYLVAGPFMQEGQITPDCRKNFGLTAREGEIIERLMEGRTNQELSELLFISRRTVENHLHSIFQKMNVKNRVQLIAVFRNGNRLPSRRSI